MKKQIESAILTLIDKAEIADGGDALRFTQAALNLAHVLAVLKQTNT
tara:strand:- start:748 stop:888 length:141 start_codon:yes stop_codon:yes gene_type:complete